MWRANGPCTPLEKNPVEYGKGIQAGRRVYGGPTEHHETRSESQEDDGIHRTKSTISQIGWNQTTDDARSICHNDERVRVSVAQTEDTATKAPI